jgi:hypothetical protein
MRNAKKLTIQDIAYIAGFSKTIISRVLNHNPSYSTALPSRDRDTWPRAIFLTCAYSEGHQFWSSYTYPITYLNWFVKILTRVYKQVKCANHIYCLPCALCIITS